MKSQNPTIKKLKDLLLSEDLGNMRLGMELSKNMGKNPELLDTMVALAMVYYHEEFEPEIIELLHRTSTASEYKNIMKAFKKAFKNFHTASYQYNVFEDLYQELEKLPFLNTHEIAIEIFKKTDRGIRYCIENKIAPVEKLLNQKIKDGFLDLFGCNLIKLPPEVASFSHLQTIDIRQNHITDFPDEWQSLNAKIIFQDNPLTEEAILKLEKWFPAMMADHYYTEDFNTYFNKKEYPDALKVIQKCLDLDPQNATYWNVKGVVLQRMKFWEESLLCLDKSLSINPEDPLTYSNKAHNLHMSKKHEASLSSALQGLALYDKNPNLSTYWKTILYFRKGQALYYLGRLEESEQAYMESLQLKPDDGASQYNLACVYTKLNQREKVIEFLNKAISNDPKFYKAAREDKDFEPFKDDETFWGSVLS